MYQRGTAVSGNKRFWFQTISREPAVRKAVDDIVLDLYGEGNPCWEEDYELNPSEEMQMGGM